MAQNGSRKNLNCDSTDVVLCAIRAPYNSCHAGVANSSVIHAYQVLLKAQQAAIWAIHPGNKASAVYAAAVSVVEREAPQLVQNLSKSAGTIGLELCKLVPIPKDVSLDAQNDRMIIPHMVFYVSLEFENLTAAFQDHTTEKFSLFLADIVIATKNGPEIHTRLKKGVKEETPASISVFNSDVNPSIPGPSKATIWHENPEMSKEELRHKHLAELAPQENEETARHHAAGWPVPGDANGLGRVSTKVLIEYGSHHDSPHSQKLMLQVDEENETILLPIFGSMVPFHVSAVDNIISFFQDRRTYQITIILNVPRTTFNPHAGDYLKFQGNIFVKEISFLTKDWREGSVVARQIRTLRRHVASRGSERATVVSQEKLQVAPSSGMMPMRLHVHISMMPPFDNTGMDLEGSLEAHATGFRYSTGHPEEKVDIIYSNIKHAFFQPAEREITILLHFHLHNHIMVGVGKKKDVQFFVEVHDAVQTLGGDHRSVSSSDEKNRINMEFHTFVNRVNDLWTQPQFKGLDLKFEMPHCELGFHGIPYNVSTFIMPTSTCLVELVQFPFLVVTLSEIGIVNLERVRLGQKNFDMAIVFKDLKKDVLRINSIPSSSLDAIKEWLDTTDLRYYECHLNLNWRSILKTITADPGKFTERGGWEFLHVYASDSQSKKRARSEESDK